MFWRTAEGEQWGPPSSAITRNPRFVSFTALHALVTVAVLALFLCPVSGQESGDEPTGLDTPVTEISVQDQKLTEIADLLSTLGGISINVAGSVDQKISVNLTVQGEKTIRQVLDNLAVQYALWIDTESQPGGVLIRPLAEKPKIEEKLLEKPFQIRFKRPSELIDFVRNFLSDRPGADALALDSEKLIVVRDIPEAIARIEEYLNRADIPVQSTVFPILYRDAQEIADLIRERLPDLEEDAITVDVANSQLIVKTTLENLAEIQLLIETLDIKKEIRVFTISFHDVDDVASVLEDLNLLSEEASLITNPDTGRMIIQDTPERLDQIAEAIAAYDTPRPAVFVEAEILDVNASYSFGWNPTLALKDGAMSETTFGDGSTISDGERIIRLAGQNAFEFAALDAGDVLARLRASENDSDVQTIASPRLLVERGEYASINVGSEEPIGVRSFQDNVYSGSSRDIVTQRTRRVGILLQIEAYNISDKGYVELNIGLENSSVPPDGRVDIGGGTTGLRVLLSNIETTAVLKDGRTLAIGGLITRDTSESSGGTPFLNKIPGVRYFFSSLARADTRRKLLLFITPHILNLDTPLEKYGRDEEDLKGQETLGQDRQQPKALTLDTTGGKGAEEEWSVSGEPQWINRNGRWGYLDERGRFVDRTDMFLGAYEQGEEPLSAAVPEPVAAPKTNGPSASELLRGLSEEKAAPKKQESKPEPKAPSIEAPKVEKAPATAEAEKPKVETPSAPAPAATTPPAVEPPKTEAPQPEPSQPATEPAKAEDSPSTAPPAQPVPPKPSAQPGGPPALLRGEAAVRALRQGKADSIGQFKGTLRDLVQRVRTETGVQFAITPQLRQEFEREVQVDGAGKTYDQVMREVLDSQGLMYQGRPADPPQIRRKSGGAAPAPPPAAPPTQPPTPGVSPTAPQSRGFTPKLDDPWADSGADRWVPTRAAANLGSLSGEEQRALSMNRSESRSGQPTPPLEPEPWEETVQHEEPARPGLGQRLSPPSGFQTRAPDGTGLTRDAWNRMLQDTSGTSSESEGDLRPLEISRHTEERTRTGARERAPEGFAEHTGQPTTWMTEPRETHPKKGMFGKIKSLLTPGRN